MLYSRVALQRSCEEGGAAAKQRGRRGRQSSGSPRSAQDDECTRILTKMNGSKEAALRVER